MNGRLLEPPPNGVETQRVETSPGVFRFGGLDDPPNVRMLVASARAWHRPSGLRSTDADLWSPNHSTMTNVVPDGGNFAAQGTIQTLDLGASTLTLAPESSSLVPMTVAPGVNLTDISVGDVASVHYTRSVTFVVGSPNVAVGQVPASTVGQVAQTPGGIGYSAATVVGRVVKLNGPSSFDVVNANGGGIYTIKTTNPARQAVIQTLKVGDSITVSVSPIIATSVAKCGLFGKGLFGC